MTTSFPETKTGVRLGLASAALTGALAMVLLAGLPARADDANPVLAKVNGSDIAVRNQIQIAGGVSDEDLQTTLVKRLQYDRVGYGTTAFNAITVIVHDGVVTLGGHAYGPTDKSSAHAVASYTPGVQDVVDEIQVDPVSLMDDAIRMKVARLIYGYPALSKYAIDPGKPIRISVQNGNVTLYGSVDSQADRDMAGIRANTAAGVFKVTNELLVDGATSERD